MVIEDSRGFLLRLLSHIDDAQSLPPELRPGLSVTRSLIAIRARRCPGRGARHLLAALDMDADRLYGHVKTDKKRTTFLVFCRCLPSLYPRCASPSWPRISAPTFRPRKTAGSVTGQRPTTSELAYVPTNASCLDRTECHFTALRYFALNGDGPPQPRQAELHDPPLHRRAGPQLRQG